MRVRVAAAVSIVLAFSHGCSLPDHQNPFDPATPAALQARATLSGRVSLEWAGAAAPDLSGVAVSLSPGGGATQTRADGRWTISDVRPGTYVLQASKAGWVAGTLGGVAVSLDDGDSTVPVPDLALALARGDAVGTVSLEGEAAPNLAGAAVTLSGVPGAAVTDGAGAWRLSGVPVGTYQARAARAGYADASYTPVNVVQGGTASVPDLHLAALPGAVSGDVLVVGAADSSGVGVRLEGTTLAGSARTIQLTTAADGHYHLAPVPAGSYNLTLSKADYVAVTTGVVVAPAADLTMPAARLQRDTGGILGTALLGGASDHSGIQVSLTPVPSVADPTPSPAAAAITDASGAWRVEVLAVGRYDVRYRKQPGYVDQAAQVEILSHQVIATGPVTLVAVPGVVRGRVLAEGRAAGQLGGTSVRIDNSAPLLQAFTDPDGAYTLSGVGAGAQTVVFERTDYEPQRVQAAVAPGDTVTLFDVTLARARGALRGTWALRGVSGAPGVVVSVQGASWSGSAVTDAAGTVLIERVPVGTYAVTASKEPDWTPSVVPGVRVDPNLVATIAGSPITLEPVATASVAVALSREDGLSASGVQVTLTGRDFRGVDVTPQTRTFTGGALAFPGLLAGSYQLAAVAPAGLDAPAPRAVSLVTGQRADAGTLALALARGTVAGTWQLAGMTAHGGVVVTVSGAPAAGGAFTTTAVTGATGALSLSVPVGAAYTVAARNDPDWGPASKAGVAVARGATTTLTGAELTLQPVRTASISGAVALEGGVDPLNADVALTGTDFTGAAVSLAVKAAGAGAPTPGGFTFAGLAAGSYQITWTRAGWDPPAPVAVSVGTGGQVALGTTRLALSRGGLAGQYALQGFAGSRAGILVTASGTAAATGAPASASAYTDAAGAFTLGALPAGTYTVVGRLDPDWQADTAAGQAVAANATTSLGATRTLQPVAAATLAGAILLEGGGSPAAALVTLSGTDFRGLPVTPPAPPAVGAATGAWSVLGLLGGSYEVTYALAGYDTPAPVGLSVGSGQGVTLPAVTLRASRGGARGRLLATGAASHAGTVVTVGGGADSASAVTDLNGDWRVTGLRVGAGYFARYAREAYVTRDSGAFTVAPDLLTTVTPLPDAVALAANGFITGVASVAGTVGARSGIAVAYRGTDLNGAAVSGSSPAPTDAAGAYQVAGLVQGTYALTFSKTAYEPVTLQGVYVAAGTTATAAPVVLQPATCTVGGVARLALGAVPPAFALGTDHSGIVVTLEGADAPVAPAVTDAAGNFRFDGVPVKVLGGSFTVRARKTHFTEASVAVPSPSTSQTVTLGAPLSLPVNAGAVQGTVAVDDTGTPAAPAAGAVTLSLTGTAFNATAYSAVASNTGAGWSLPDLPPGTYDVLATAAGRDCGGPAIVTVAAGATVDLTPGSGATFTCADAVAPTGVALGTPQGPGADPGYTASTAVALPVVAHATDASGNLAGYEYVVGAVPAWTFAPTTAGTVSPIPFPAGALGPAAGTYTLWVRAVDRVGNRGPPSSATVVYDPTAPATVLLSTQRLYVNDTTTTAVISGGADPNFKTYQACYAALASATAACGAPCALADAGATVPISLAADVKTCVWAAAKDRAGNVGAPSLIEIVSDLTPPTGPVVAPLYDPTLLTVRADYVDFFVSSAATDGPAGSAAAWANVAWIEVDTGGGFVPLCPDASCRPGNRYQPCAAACQCSDARRVCRGTTLNAIRVPLLRGTATDVAVRAVDVAGNVGSGASQRVQAGGVVTTLGAGFGVGEGHAHTRGRLLGYLASSPTTHNLTARLWDLGTNFRWDATDVNCDLSAGTSSFGPEPISSGAVVSGNGTNGIELRRPDPALGWCGAGDTKVQLANANARFNGAILIGLSGALDSTGTRERVAAAAFYGADIKAALLVREPGPDGRLGTADDAGADGLVGTVDDPGWVTILPSTSVATSSVTLQLAGDTLLYRVSSGAWTVVNGQPTGFAAPRSIQAFPGAVFAASLSSDGGLLAWAEPHLATSPVGVDLHVSAAGPDGQFLTTDDVTVTRTVPIPTGTRGDLAIEQGHVLVVENTVVGTSTYYLDHWYAGGDGAFGTADDAFAQVMPSSQPYYWPALGSGLGSGVAYVQQNSNGDLYAFDLSQVRWEVAATAQVSLPGTNRAGTLFYRDGAGRIAARTSDGRETRSPYPATQAGAFVADEDAVYVVSGTRLYRSFPDAQGLYFTGASPDVQLFGKMPTGTGLQGAADGLVILRTTFPSPASLMLLDPVSLATVALSTVANHTPITSFDAASVSSLHAVWVCRDTSSIQHVCYRDSVNGVYGDPDDVTSLLPTTYNGGYYVKASGNRIAFTSYSGSGKHLFVMDAGLDRKLATTADNTVIDVMGVGTGLDPPFDLAGDYLAWVEPDAVLGGVQVWLMNLADRTKRPVTDWFSNKDSVRVDPTGRVYWYDTLFLSGAIFVSSP